MESILRTAHCLVMPALIEAAQQYIIRYVVQKAPVEVATCLCSVFWVQACDKPCHRTPMHKLGETLHCCAVDGLWLAEAVPELCSSQDFAGPSSRLCDR